MKGLRRRRLLEFAVFHKKNSEKQRQNSGRSAVIVAEPAAAEVFRQK
jgi:hypothetical protein